MATYRLRLKVREEGQELALKMFPPSTAFALYADDELLAEGGTVSPDRERFRECRAPQTVVFRAPADAFDLIVHVANYDYAKGGGADPRIYPGEIFRADRPRHRRGRRGHFWAEARRKRLEEACVRLTVRLSRYYASSGNPDRAVALQQRGLESDRLHTGLNGELLTLYAGMGDLVAARPGNKPANGGAEIVHFQFSHPRNGMCSPSIYLGNGLYRFNPGVISLPRNRKAASQTGLSVRIFVVVGI